LGSDAQPLLQASGLCAHYGKVQALSNVDLQVGPASVVTVIGPNGAGKSTLLGSLMGMRRTTGSVTYAGHDLARVAPEQRVGRGLCLVTESRDLFGSMSVLDNLCLGFYSRRREGQAAMRAELERVFAMFPRLRERSAQLANTLSGGERQMLVLGRALMSRPRLLMLDEPSLGLAPLVVREVFASIAKLRRDGVSVLLVEQNARAALAVADYGYVLEMGVVRAHGPASLLAGDPRIVESYLGTGGAEPANDPSARRPEPAAAVAGRETESDVEGNPHEPVLVPAGVRADRRALR
jgi:branched-chain amino acid transport system ATP-binding protein